MTVLLVNLMSVAADGPQAAQAEAGLPSAFPEYQIKAAFLYNFAKFVEWPSTAFNASDSPLVIGVFGSDPFDGELDRAVQDKVINGHRLVVQRIDNIAEIHSCQMLFVPGSEKKRIAEVLAMLKGSAVLTVGETGGFLEAGGMINFVLDEKARRVRFEINNGAARRANLKISSKLLNLAERIED